MRQFPLQYLPYVADTKSLLVVPSQSCAYQTLRQWRTMYARHLIIISSVVQRSAPNKLRVFAVCCAGKWHGEDVAVKVINHETAKDAKRAGNEVGLSMRLKHPNVVRCLYFEVISLPSGVNTAFSLRPHLEDIDQSASSNQVPEEIRVGWIPVLLCSKKQRCVFCHCLLKRNSLLLYIS